MARTVLPRTDRTQPSIPTGDNNLFKRLEREGRLPPIDILIKPLNGSPNIALDRFLSYNFSSSILIPVDSFSFAFVAPDGPSLDTVIKEGDIVVLSANNIQLATGIIDQTEIETDREFGEKGAIIGRDLMGQLEDQDAVSIDSRPIFANQTSVQNGIRRLIEETRITNIELRNAPRSNYLLATEPGERKLSALQRFLEPLNCLAWMGPSGQLIVGKPNMAQRPRGKFILSKSKRKANCTSIRVSRAAAQLPNVVIPVWSGQELVTERVSLQQRLFNAAPGPARLFKFNHRVPRTVVVSAPNATNPQGLSDVNALKAGGANILQAYAKREIARQNLKEIVVEVAVPGHFNESGEPFRPDTVYRIEYDRGNVDEDMYLFQVDYQGSEDSGQTTNLQFCRLGAIVSDVEAP